MIPITIEIKGIEDALAKIDKLKFGTPHAIQHGINRAMEETMQIANGILQARTGFSGAMPRPAESISANWNTVVAERKGNVIIGGLQNLSDHAEFVEFGTAAHRDPEAGTGSVTGMGNLGGVEGIGKVIEPLGAGPLHFFIGGKEIWRDYVRGQPPIAYLRTAVQDIQRDLALIFKEAQMLYVGF